MISGRPLIIAHAGLLRPVAEAAQDKRTGTLR